MPRRRGGPNLGYKGNLENYLALFHAYTAAHMSSRVIVKGTFPQFPIPKVVPEL